MHGEAMSNEEERERVVRLEVPCEPESLPLVRLITRKLAEDVGFPEAEAVQVETAVSEACANVLEHGFGAMGSKPPIELVIGIDSSCMAVDIIDRGVRFDFEAHHVPTFPDHWKKGHTRGAGIYLIRRFMDEVGYERLDDRRNRLRMVKKR
jgi:serine/threonine-protein kinase RsbW